MKFGGATIERQCRVTDLLQRADGSWDVVTEKGTIHAEHVVNAGGLWAREIGRMVGLELPILAMEHMYLLTEDMPEVAEANKATGKEVLHTIDRPTLLLLQPQDHAGVQRAGPRPHRQSVQRGEPHR